jgi:hypothetical protein
MKTIKFFAVALATTALLASCLKDNTAPANEPLAKDGNASVFIKVNHGETRAVANKITNYVPNVGTTDAYVVFMKDDGTIVDVITAKTGTNSGAAYDEENKVIGYDALTGGTWIKGVPETATKVGFAANMGTATIGNGGNISDIKLTVAAQYNSVNGDVSKVALYGEVDLVEDPDGAINSGLSEEDTYMKTEEPVKVFPVASRLEIGKISAKHRNTTESPAKTGTTQFDIMGIFVDGYYSQMGINGTGLAADFMVNTDISVAGTATMDDIFRYVASSPVGSYTAALRNIVYDYNTGVNPAPLATGVGATGVTASANVNQAWSYNILAAGATPKLILRLRNMSADYDGTGSGEPTDFDGDQYITINLKKDATTPLTWEPGKIYTIPEIVVYNDSVDNSYTPKMNVQVIVEIQNWDPVTIVYED